MAGEKILPFENEIILSGRELEIKSTWEYILFEIQSDRNGAISLISNFLDPGLLIAEWADGSDFDFGINQGGTNLLFTKNYSSEFNGIVYLLSKVNFEDFTSLNFSVGFTQIDYSQIKDFPLTEIIVNTDAAINGNFGNLPSTVKIFNDQGISEIKNYSGSNFSDGITLIRLLPIFPYFLFTSQVDQLIIDLSLKTWGPGGILNLAGYNQPRSAASDAAVIDLQNQGVTVTVNATDNNNDYYMYNNQFDNLNSANLLTFNPATPNILDFTAVSGEAIILNGLWFISWVQNNVVTDPLLFSTTIQNFEIKLVGGGLVSISANTGAYTPVVFSYVCLANKLYTLQSDGTRFVLFENGSQVDSIAIGANIPNLMGVSTAGSSLFSGPSDPIFSYMAFGVNGIKLHEYLLFEGVGNTLYDSVGGFDAILSGGANWTLGQNTPIIAGNQIGLNNWNLNGGVVIPENKSNLGFDVLGDPIKRFKLEDGYNFPGLPGVGFNATNLLDRTGRGTDLFILNFSDFSGGPLMKVCGDDVFNFSIIPTGANTGQSLVEYVAVTLQGSFQLNAGVNYMIGFITDGGGGGQLYIGTADQDIFLDIAGGVAPSGPPTTIPMSYGMVPNVSPNDNFNGYISHGVHFPRELNAQELFQAWAYYRRFL